MSSDDASQTEAFQVRVSVAQHTLVAISQPCVHHVWVFPSSVCQAARSQLLAGHREAVEHHTDGRSTEVSPV